MLAGRSCCYRMLSFNLVNKFGDYAPGRSVLLLIRLIALFSILFQFLFVSLF